MWQDIAFSVIGIVFNISLVLQLRDVIVNKTKMNTPNCIVTCIGCAIIAYVDLTLNLPFAAIISVITALLWGLMVVYPIIIASPKL
jgi:hypothetical protein